MHSVFGNLQKIENLDRLTHTEANRAIAGEVDVVVCVTGKAHLLDGCPWEALFERRISNCQPEMLGFECEAVLRDRLGSYDFYGYVEDDLIIRDPWFFEKLRLFNRCAPADALLLPNRYEIAQSRAPEKVYVDGDLARSFIEPVRSSMAFMQPEIQPQIVLSYLEAPVIVRRPRNPHSGCYFLSQEQLKRWAASPWFLDRDTSFCGPLESAATNGILRTFRIYKPAPRNAAFLEIEHYGNPLIRRFAERRKRVDQRKAREGTGRTT
jgi:hypothetical protein